MSAYPWPRPTGASQSPLMQARVDGAQAPGWRVRAAGRSCVAGVAASCLLRPQADDLVLVFAADDGPAYIVAVLERARDEGCLHLPGGAQLLGDAQGLRLRARRLRLHGAQALQLCSARVEVHARHGRFTAGLLELRAGCVHGLFGRLQASSREWIARIGRGFAEFGDSVRRVRGIDQTDAVQQRVRVEQRFHVQCGDASVLARNRARIDAPRIDLG